MKIILILCITGILAISSVGCDINSKMKNSKSDQQIETLNENKSIDEKIAIDNATDINIEICVADVVVKTYDGEDVKVIGKLSEKSEGIDVNKNGNKINIVEKEHETIGFNNDDVSKINILCPSKFKGNLIFKQGSVTSSIEGIKVKNIDIKGGAGTLKCEDIKFDKLNINSGAGKFDLNLKEKCGDIEIDGGVGELNLKMAEVGGNLQYKGGVGKIDITIPENSPVKFVTGNGVGECNIDAKTSGKETYTFDLKVGVGSINIKN